MWEKEKMLVTSIFSFTHNVFFSSPHELLFLSRNYFVVFFYFEFRPALSFGKELNRLVKWAQGQPGDYRKRDFSFLLNPAPLNLPPPPPPPHQKKTKDCVTMSLNNTLYIIITKQKTVVPCHGTTHYI